MTGSVLVAGVGNIFLGDDGFGVEVARRLSAEPLPANVRVADYGIRGVHLAYQLLEGYDTLILVDTISRGNPPGTVSLIEPDLTRPPGGDPLMDAHDLDPASVLGLVRHLGGRIDRVLVVGCEPQDMQECIGLSEPVQRAVDEAARMVRELLNDARTTKSSSQGEA
jgi:hydrogenase maturation protease